MTEEQLLNTAGLQAVVVETRVEGLLKAGETCVNAGMHIHLDKPPGSSLTQFRRLLASADRQGLTVQMGYMYRYNPAVVMLRDLLQKGWLGEIFEVHAVMSKEVAPPTRSPLTTSIQAISTTRCSTTCLPSASIRARRPRSSRRRSRSKALIGATSSSAARKARFIFSRSTIRRRCWP